jgi:hypothetical protein
VLQHLAEHSEPGPAEVLAVSDALAGLLDEQWRGCACCSTWPYAEIAGTEHVALTAGDVPDAVVVARTAAARLLDG